MVVEIILSIIYLTRELLDKAKALPVKAGRAEVLGVDPRR